MKNCNGCSTKFEPTSPKNIYCHVCALARRREQSARYKKEAKGTNIVCTCGTIFKSYKNRKYCDTCRETRMRKVCNKCSKTFIETSMFRRLCDECVTENKKLSIAKQTLERQEGIDSLLKKPVNKINPKFLERGRKMYQGYTSL